MSARERLEARRRIERLLDEDRRRVAPPPEKAATLVGWLDHERRRCSLEGATTTSSFGRVDDGSKTNGRATQTDLRSKKGKISSSIKTNLRVQSRVHQVMPPKPYPHPPVGQRTKEGAKTEGARPERPLLQLRGGPAAPGPPSQPHPRAQGGGGSGAEDEGDAGLTARRREPAMEGGRGEAPGRCGPAATSIGGAVARRPQWRSGLASPRWSSAATHSRSWQRCGGAGRSRGAWPDAREGRADPDAEPRGRTTRRHAGPVAPPWRCGTRRGRRAAPPWGGQGRGRSFCA